MLRFPERDLFLRGVRAFAGFKQTGVDYLRPERMFGVTTNNFWKNIGWAKKGILSFSNVPLNILSVAGSGLLLLTLLLIVVEAALRLFFPELAPSRSPDIADLNSLLWFDQFVRHQPDGRVHQQGIRGSKTQAAFHSKRHHTERRGSDRSFR